MSSAGLSVGFRVVLHDFQHLVGKVCVVFQISSTDTDLLEDLLPLGRNVVDIKSSFPGPSDVTFVFEVLGTVTFTSVEELDVDQALAGALFSRTRRFSSSNWVPFVLGVGVFKITDGATEGKANFAKVLLALGFELFTVAKTNTQNLEFGILNVDLEEFVPPRGDAFLDLGALEELNTATIVHDLTTEDEGGGRGFGSFTTKTSGFNYLQFDKNRAVSLLLLRRLGGSGHL